MSDDNDEWGGWLAKAQRGDRDAYRRFLVAITPFAHPLDPLPVAILGGLGSAAAAALLLQFFHPFAITAEDFAVHLIAVVLVITMFARANRKILAPTR